jgi:hypothetical protein
MPLKATVNRIGQFTTFTANGKLVQTYLVNFSVGDHGPFQIQIPADQFNAENVQKAMQPTVDGINALIPAG